MKKIFTLSLLGFFFGAYAQLPVSQVAEKKKAVIEEYTGKTCQYCPLGHQATAALQAADPDNVFVINVHTGQYADGTPNYRTTFGPSLAGQTGLTGYPTGTVNRHTFGANTTALGTSEFTPKTNAIKTQDAYVNVAADATIDIATNLLTVKVEAYYTAASPASSNFLNVAITQDDIHGPQTVASIVTGVVYDSEGLYIHNHMLRHMMTGQWGEEINTVSMGTLVEKTYTYTLPEIIGDVPVDISKLHIIAFMTETHQEIINGNAAELTFTSPNSVEAQAISAFTPETSCSSSFDPEISIRNLGSTAITSMKIEYSANNLPVQTYDWTGNLTIAQTANIVLPTLMFNSQDSSDIMFKIAEINGGDDELLTNNELSAVVKNVPEYQTQSMTLEFTTDTYASETSWKLYNAAGTVIQENGALANSTPYTETLTLADNDCYTFEFLDSYGDGITGTFTLKFGTETVLEGSGSFTKVSKGFATVDAAGNGNGNPTDNVDTTRLGILDVELVANFSVFPNPSTDVVNINMEVKNNISVQVELLDVLGRNVMSTELNDGIASFNVSKLNKGIYILNATSEGKAIATTSLVVR